MAKLTIIGNPSPVVGKKEMYTISTINDYFQQIIPTQPLLNLQTPIHWGIFVQEKNTWRRTTDNKEGQAVPYTFGQKSLHFKAIKIVAQQGNESGELIIHPQQAKEPKITKVELLDANYLPLPKGKKISYQDTIIARAHCIEMYKRNVSFTLWEDDAKGEGHDPVINMMNKINPVPIMGIVDEYGVAEAVFRLPFYTMAVQIANARIARGETDEGPTHEYYVTAEYVAKHIMKASPNVNVINPTHIPPTPPSKTSSNTPETKPIKPKPKADTPKFPITSSGKKQADPDAKILNAEFLNERAQPIEKAEVGDTVIIKITTQHMKGRNVTVRIWEEETGYKTHDKIYEKKWVLPGNENFIKVPITKKIYELGITPEDMRNEKYDYKFQVYFIEVEPDNTHVTSQVIPITKSAKKLEVENSRSVAIIKKVKEEKEDKVCEYEARVRAFMRMLRYKEGTDKEIGYTTQYSGKQFTDMSKHPEKVITAGKYSSSAAGAYQIMTDTWKNLNGYYQGKDKKSHYSEKLDYAKKYNIKSFDQESQDKFCLVIMKHNYLQDRSDSFYNPTIWKDKEKKNHDIAKEEKLKNWRKRFKGQQGDIIQMIIDDDIKRAALVSSLCWASLPDSPYGQQDSAYTYAIVKAIYENHLREELTETQTWNLHLKKGFLKEFGYGCCEGDIKKEEPTNSTCPEDCSQCIEYADVVDNPRINDQSNNVNKNRFHREMRKNKTYPKGYYHTGTDILASLNTSLKSMLCGEVTEAYNTGGDLGIIVTIKSKDKDGDFIWIRYCHLNSLSVKKGQKIKHGANIGLSGNTGNAKGVLPQYYHVHIEASTDGVFYKGKTRVDPEQFMKTKFDETTKGNPIK